MKAELKRKWIKALRSKRYRQTKGMLHRIQTVRHREHGFCCLGVLCRVMGIEEKTERGSERGTFDGVGGVLSTQLQVKAELEEEKMNRLVALNDEEGYSFSQIASWILKNIKGTK